MRRLLAVLVMLPCLAHADPFTYDPPGKLQPGSGTGRADTALYAPGMRFPMETGPAFANSQVWGHGGGKGTGSQCDEENFSYPWHDNFCESRSWSMPLCPSGTGHQGQDIRAATCEKGVHWVVAVAAGTITQVGSYTVYLTTDDGTRFDYLHMQDVQVKEGDDVKRGQRVGKVSNKFGGSATTVHLHFNMRQNVAGVGQVFVPPYASLVDAYDRLVNPRPDAGVVDASAPEAGVRDASVPLDPAPTDSGVAAAGQLRAEVDDDSGCTVSTAPADRSGFAILGAASAAALLRRRRRR